MKNVTPSSDEEKINEPSKRTNNAEADMLREFLVDLEELFRKIDEIREKYKDYIGDEADATVEDSSSVKKLLKKYSQLL